ncbi:IQ motif and ankyrin repeat domain-containing protein 1-like [Babylonia areolata]|uniref:IQ motif and ankyrin repeat domain-containing protein 1-like n=1 Tax=Babylonia areolata TaxID=304850 RepID=UPI003FD6B7F9
MSTKKVATKPVTKTAPKGGATGTAKKTAVTKGGTAAAAKPAAAPAKPKPEALPEVEIGLKELMSVLGDTQGKIKESGRWPLVIDENGRVAVFLHHRDCNTLNALDQLEMAPEMIRKALLGAIRYGKPMVINLVENGDINIVKDRFDDIMPDLFNLVLTKKILQDDLYMKLTRPNDDADFKNVFGVQQGFIFMFITTNPTPTDDTKSNVIVFRIV